MSLGQILLIAYLFLVGLVGVFSVSISPLVIGIVAFAAAIVIALEANRGAIVIGR